MSVVTPHGLTLILDLISLIFVDGIMLICFTHDHLEYLLLVVWSRNIFDKTNAFLIFIYIGYTYCWGWSILWPMLVIIMISKVHN